MQFSKEQHFLILECAEAGHPCSLSIAESLSSKLAQWRSSTRVSPVFKLLGFGDSSVAFRGKGSEYAAFLGPLDPDRLRSFRADGCSFWLSLGILNVISITSSAAAANRLVSWAKKNSVNIELWHLSSGVVNNVRIETVLSSTSGWRQRIAKLCDLSTVAELDEALREYCPLAASALARAELLGVSDIASDLSAINEFVSQSLREFKPGKGGDSPYPLLGQLLTVSAGLSRFTFQTFSGVPPIANSECHIRSHSLLGIAIADLGLRRICSFLQATLGESRIPERFSGFTNIHNRNNLLTLPVTDPFWWKDHLNESVTSINDPEPLVPLLSYFSARDGFKSSLMTISAPLTSAYRNSPMDDIPLKRRGGRHLSS